MSITCNRTRFDLGTHACARWTGSLLHALLCSALLSCSILGACVSKVRGGLEILR